MSNAPRSVTLSATTSMPKLVDSLACCVDGVMRSPVGGTGVEVLVGMGVGELVGVDVAVGQGPEHG